MDIVAFVISTAFGTGQAAMHTALADGRESMALRPDIIGNNYRAQLCVFAPNKSLAGVLDRVLDLISSALQDLTDQLAARAINWPSDVSLVLLTPGADIGFPIEKQPRSRRWWNHACEMRAGFPDQAKPVCYKVAQVPPRRHLRQRRPSRRQGTRYC